MSKQHVTNLSYPETFLLLTLMLFFLTRNVCRLSLLPPGPLAPLPRNYLKNRWKRKTYNNKQCTHKCKHWCQPGRAWRFSCFLVYNLFYNLFYNLLYNLYKIKEVQLVILLSVRKELPTTAAQTTPCTWYFTQHIHVHNILKVALSLRSQLINFLKKYLKKLTHMDYNKYFWWRNLLN